MNNLKLQPILLLMACLAMVISCHGDEIAVGPGLRDPRPSDGCQVCKECVECPVLPNLSANGMCTEIAVTLCDSLNGDDCGVEEGWTRDSCIGQLMEICGSSQVEVFDTLKTNLLYSSCLPTIRKTTCTLSKANKPYFPEECSSLFSTNKVEKKEEENDESI